MLPLKSVIYIIVYKEKLRKDIIIVRYGETEAPRSVCLIQAHAWSQQ